VLRQIHSLFQTGAVGDLTDGELLEQFRTRRREIADHAFTALVERHGPMVWRVCRRLLSDPHEAEDAFQATFLVLVQHGVTIRRSDSVSSWLYGVACRIARNARLAAARRRKHEQRRVGTRWQRPGSELVESTEVSALLADELSRLPERYRAPLVLCDLEDETHEKAAAHLGWPVGTVKSRLARGREKLRSRLVRRGLAPSVGATAAILAADQAQGGVPAALVDSTVRLGMAMATGVSAAGALSGPSFIWAREVSKAMWISNLRWSAVAAVTAVAAGIGGMFVWQRSEAQPQPGNIARAEAPLNPRQRDDDDAIWARHAGNLKRIGLAVHNYVTAEGHFPPAAITGKDGKPLLSWRVAILPYLEDYDASSREDLFKQFHVDEPWDSPHNKALLAKMPAVFASPSNRDAQAFTTTYRGFVSDEPQAAAGAGMGMMMRGMMSGQTGMGAMGPGPKMQGGMSGGADAMQKGMAGMMGRMGNMRRRMPGMMGGMMGSRKGVDARAKQRQEGRASQAEGAQKEEQKDGAGAGAGAAMVGGAPDGAMMAGGGAGATEGDGGAMMAGAGDPGNAPAAMMAGGGAGGGGGEMMGGYGGMMRSMMAGMGGTTGELPSPTVFRLNHGLPIASITDGTSNTLMVVEAAEAVPWTKPEELPVQDESPLPRLGGSMRGGLAALFADGRVRFLDQPIQERVLRFLITPSGGEIISADDLPRLDEPPPGGMTITREPQTGGGSLPADARRYAGAGTLLNAVGILRDKLNREGKSELAEWLSEAKARRTIRAGLEAYENYLRRSGEPQESRAQFEIARPVFEQIAEQGTWPADCWFSSTSSVETRDRIGYDHYQVHLNLEGLDQGKPFQLSVLILDLLSGPVDVQPAARRH
jgi:RNA polymerase sigma factor (sigma-70 family)